MKVEDNDFSKEQFSHEENWQSPDCDDQIQEHDQIDNLARLLERFYLSLSNSNSDDIIGAYVNLEAYCPNPDRGESWEIQDEIVKDARRKCLSLIRSPYVDKTNQLNTTARKRLKQRTALSSDNDGGNAVAHGQRYMFIMMDVLGTWSNWLVELRGFGFRREMITQLMSILYPRIIEIVWDTFQTFKQDKDLEKLCAKSTDINTELHLNTLDNTLQQLATMRSLVNKHYIFQYDLFTPYFLIEFDSEEELQNVPLVDRLVLVTNEEIQRWKELDFLYSSLEAAYLLRSVTVACMENDLLEIEDGVFILHLVEDVLFLMNKVMDRALLTSEDGVVFALGNKLLELVHFGGHGGMQDALLYEIVSTSVLYRRVSQCGYLSGRQARSTVEHIIHKCTGRNLDDTDTMENTTNHLISNNSNFQTPSKPPMKPLSHPTDVNDPQLSKGELPLDALWKGANSWLTTLTSPYIPRSETDRDHTGDDKADCRSPENPNTPSNSTCNSIKTQSFKETPVVTTSASQPSLEELLLKAFDEDMDPHNLHSGDADAEEDNYDPYANPDDPAIANASTVDLSAALIGGAQTAAAASAVGVSGGFLLFSATSSLVSAFLSDGSLDTQAANAPSSATSTSDNANNTTSSNAAAQTQSAISQREQQQLAKGFEIYLRQLFNAYHVHHQQALLRLETSQSPAFNENSGNNHNPSSMASSGMSEGYLGPLMPRLPLPLQDADAIIQLNTMMILTQGIRNLQDALDYAASSNDLFLSQRTHHSVLSSSPIPATTNANNATNGGSPLQVLSREYEVCIRMYRENILAEVQSLAMRQMLRHLPTLASASQALMMTQASSGGASVYGLLGNWLLGNGGNSANSMWLRKRNESLLQATSLFLQSNFEITGAEMEQRWTLQLLRSYVNHFLSDLAPLGPSFSFKLQEAQEISKRGEAAKFSFGGLAMSLFANANKPSISNNNSIANSGNVNGETNDIHRRSELCYVLARQYVLSFLQILIRILYEQCLLQRQFNEWGALLFQEEMRSFVRYVEAIFEDRSLAALAMRYEEYQDNGNEDDKQPGHGEEEEEEEVGLLSWRSTKRQLHRLMQAVKLLSLDAPADIVRYTFVAPVSNIPSSMAAASSSTKNSHNSGSSKGPAGAVEMAEEDIRAILARRSDFTKETVQKVKINFFESK